MLDLSILYRGPLSSCNYACGYCPFAKRHETAAELAVDRQALERFVSWIEGRTGDRLGILFTPWGEALTRKWYQAAMVALSHRPQIRRVAIQTNLSCRLDWIGDCNRSRAAFWCTYHPGETTRAAFLAQCRILDQTGVRYSVGIVGRKEHLDEAAALRRELAPHVYLWINAYKDEGDYYQPEDLARCEAIDPLFAVNNVRHASAGEACRAGETAISVDGAGTVRRCHFIRAPIGNLYDGSFEAKLTQRACSNLTCGCHIGYVHLERLGLDTVFGDGLLERIPAAAWHDLPPWRGEEQAPPARPMLNIVTKS